MFAAHEPRHDHHAGTPARTLKEGDYEGNHDSLGLRVDAGPDSQSNRREEVGRQSDTTRSETVNQRAPEWGDEEPDNCGGPQQQRRKGGRESAHVVEVHHKHRESDAVAKAVN